MRNPEPKGVRGAAALAGKGRDMADRGLSEQEVRQEASRLHVPRGVLPLVVVDLVLGGWRERRLESAAANLGRAGGQSRSEAKAAAARANGRRGGRPRKVG